MRDNRKLKKSKISIFKVLNEKRHISGEITFKNETISKLIGKVLVNISESFRKKNRQFLIYS